MQLTPERAAAVVDAMLDAEDIGEFSETKWFKKDGEYIWLQNAGEGTQTLAVRAEGTFLQILYGITPAGVSFSDGVITAELESGSWAWLRVSDERTQGLYADNIMAAEVQPGVYTLYGTGVVAAVYDMACGELLQLAYPGEPIALTGRECVKLFQWNRLSPVGKVTALQ
ncbi:MAG: hypothetical protein IJN25_05290 [Clostridia bacterium]|nr:hypothetical protein [Clostridia bacterium]